MEPSGLLATVGEIASPDFNHIFFDAQPEGHGKPHDEVGILNLAKFECFT